MGGRTVAELRLPWGTPHVDAHHAGSIVAQVLAIRDRLDERCRFLTHLLGSCDWAIPKARPCPRQRLRIERQVVIPASSVGHTRRVERMGMHANQPVRFGLARGAGAQVAGGHKRSSSCVTRFGPARGTGAPVAGGRECSSSCVKRTPQLRSCAGGGASRTSERMQRLPRAFQHW